MHFCRKYGLGGSHPRRSPSTHPNGRRRTHLQRNTPISKTTRYVSHKFNIYSLPFKIVSVSKQLMLILEQFTVLGVRTDGTGAINVLSRMHHRLRSLVPRRYAGVDCGFPTLLHCVNLRHWSAQPMEAHPQTDQTLRETHWLLRGLRLGPHRYRRCRRWIQDAAIRFHCHELEWIGDSSSQAISPISH